MKLRNHNAILVTIVIAQFLCTSLWFAGNGVLQDLIVAFDLPLDALGHLTTAIQFGFICGTLVFALYKIADRFSPSQVFLYSAIGGALANIGMMYVSNTYTSLLGLRFITGLFLAGVYPVGMKIAADYFDKGLGKALGLLVGALVVGTALPHLLKAWGSGMDWRYVLIWISALAIVGGLIIGLLVQDGPHRHPGQGMDVHAMFRVFKLANFRRPSFGYFGHMWEVYTFWAFAPVMLTYYAQLHSEYQIDVSFWSFVMIGVGGISCVINGYVSNLIGASKAAIIALVISGVCCSISPVVFQQPFIVLFFIFMIIWGMSVVADSPMFSTLVAQEAPANVRGTAITIVVCIGFAITIVSIQLLNWLSEWMEIRYIFLFLVPGPVLGLLAMFKRNVQEQR